MAPPLLRHRLLPFLLLLYFLSLQMMFRLGIHLPAETAEFCRNSRYSQYFFRYEIGGYLYRCTDQNGKYQLYWPVRYGIDFLDKNRYYFDTFAPLSFTKKNFLEICDEFETLFVSAH